jgi:hypothetical protein
MHLELTSKTHNSQHVLQSKTPLADQGLLFVFKYLPHHKWDKVSRGRNCV